MKRYGKLWHQIIDWSNLLLAARYAQKGKRFRDNVLAFNYNLEPELFKLQSELSSKSYCPGDYRSFRIYDPKPRLISAAPYRDRVVHHALCNIIVPLIEKSFIHDTYANRVGYGTHRALARFIQFARSSLRLIIHPIKSQLFETGHGANFVGFRVLPDRVRVRTDNLRRARKRFKQLQADYGDGELSVQELIQRLQSWSSHLKHGDTYQLQEDIFRQYTFTRLS